MARRPSITDIAGEAGVSIATVSLALRDKGRMSDETRARIKSVADSLGYVPNATARSLVGGRTQLISITMPGISDVPEVVGSVEYYFKLLGAAASRALELDYSLLIASPSDSPERAAVDGGIVVDPSHDDPTLSAFDRQGRPVVTIGRRLDPIGPDAGPDLLVDNDYPGATSGMLDHLRECGAAKVALLATEPIDSFQRDSIDAYLAWCSVNEVESRVVMSDSPMPSDAAVAAQALIERSGRPDGVYATIDTLAESLLDRARSHDLDVPGDLLIATCSDGQIARSTSPPLTTIDEQPTELARAAVTMLVAAMLDPEPEPAFIQVGTELLVRPSTAG